MARCLVMGVVNATPDSFSDGGRYTDLDAALAHALRLADEGADWLDIGGESTRPGAKPAALDLELERTLPLIEAIRARSPVKMSIDTMKPQVATAAFVAGARLWNDVSALASPTALQTAANLGGEVVLMHMRGEPRTMQDDPCYDDVVGEVEAFLLARAQAARGAGVAADAIWLDPGLGFGKTLGHNLALLRALPRLTSHGYRLVIGASRKRMIAAIDPRRPEPDHRLGGSIALALAAVRGGAAMVRVHDVAETVQAITVATALDD